MHTQTFKIYVPDSRAGAAFGMQGFIVAYIGAVSGALACFVTFRHFLAKSQCIQRLLAERSNYLDAFHRLATEDVSEQRAPLV